MSNAQKFGILITAILVAVLAGGVLEHGQSPMMRYEYNLLSKLHKVVSGFSRSGTDSLEIATRTISDPNADPAAKIEAYQMRALIYSRTGQLGMAKRDITAAMTLKPMPDRQHVSLEFTLGSIDALRGEYGAAIPHFTSALRASPSKSDVRLSASFCRAYAYLKIGEYTRSLSDIAEAQKQFENAEREVASMAPKLPDSSGRLRAAAQHMHTRWLSGILSVRAAALRGNGDNRDSLAYYSQAIAVAPRDPKLFAARGQTRFLSGELRAGVQDLTHAAYLSFHTKDHSSDRAIECGP